MGDAEPAESTVRVRQIGGRVELAVLVPAAGGAGSYGAATFDAQALRALVRDLRLALWALEASEPAGDPGPQP